MVKTEAWPVVVQEDIPPARSQDRCLYCRQALGDPHNRDCVKILKFVEYEILAEGHRVGTHKDYEPHYWRRQDMEDRKNLGNWCANNVVSGDTIWTDKEVQALAEKLAGNEVGYCCCRYLTVRFLRALDNGPFIDRKEKHEDDDNTGVV